MLNSLHATSMLRGCPRVFAFVVGARVYRRAGASLSGLSRRRVMCALKRCHLLFYPVWTTPVAKPTASPPKGTAKTARPRMNQMSTPPNADFSYLALCASLYFFASSTQHSLLSFIARDGIVVLGGEMRCLAGGATGKDRVGPGIARAANEARARGRTRATAPAGSIAATMRVALRVLRAMKDTLDRLAFSRAKTWRKVPNFVFTDR